MPRIRNWSTISSACDDRVLAPVVRDTGAGGTAPCGCNTGALIPTLPPTSSRAFGVNSLPSASSSKLPIHRSPAVPTSTVFDPAIGPQYLPCSKRVSRGPRRRLDGCKGIHHTRSPNLSTRASPGLFVSIQWVFAEHLSLCVEMVCES